MQQLEVSHSPIRNRDGISYSTAIYKESETTLLMFTKHSPEARQLNLCCPSCCPTHHASSSSWFQWHMPMPTTAQCEFHIQIFLRNVCLDEHVHVVTLWYPSYVPVSGNACIQHGLKATGAKYAHAARQRNWCSIAHGLMCTRVHACMCVCVHACKRVKPKPNHNVQLHTWVGAAGVASGAGGRGRPHRPAHCSSSCVVS